MPKISKLVKTWRSSSRNSLHRFLDTV